MTASLVLGNLVMSTHYYEHTVVNLLIIYAMPK